MYWLLFSGAVVFGRTESAFGKYNGRIGGKNLIFNCAKLFSAFLVGLVFALFSGITFHVETLYYASFYGLMLAVACYCGLKALSLGSMAICSMLASFSLVVPVLVGFVFLDERVSVLGIIGLVLICISILLLSYKKQTSPISLKCWIYSILTMLSNGICSAVQKLHQTQFPGEFRIEFMVFSMGCALLVFLFAIPFACKKGQEKVRTDKRALYFGSIAGACNFASNFCVLYLSASENALVLFPILSALNMVGACLVGRIFFKEKISLIQAISIIIGICSVVLLKI